VRCQTYTYMRERKNGSSNRKDGDVDFADSDTSFLKRVQLSPLPGDISTHLGSLKAGRWTSAVLSVTSSQMCKMTDPR
jgi:hypothetical protein